ncbi:MAG: tetratricopeptide repeat protein [Bacteroidetes bacterium]|nr:tetratricopeptide repeat protein [Bacteroidota bacterium]MBS1630652.1 tetratricopeptide repeat protein [Bacteroidota bacterium]
MRQSAFLILLLSAGLLACKGNRKPAPGEAQTIYLTPAIRPYTEKILKDTMKAEAWFNRGAALHQLGKDSLALQDWYHAARLDSNRADYASAIGDLLFEHKDLNASVGWLQRALRHNPEDPKAQLKVAKMMLFTKDYEQAFTAINTALRKDAFNPEGYYLKGMVYKELKDTSKAISSFQTALNVKPDYRDAAIQLGQIYSQNHNKLGLDYYAAAFKMDTTDVFPLYARGMYFQNEKNFEAAKEEYRHCVERDPQYADAVFAMGYILLQQDSFSKARRQFDLVTRISPADARAYYNRGLCSELMGDKDAAAADYRQALNFNSHYANAAEGLDRVRR